MRLWNPNTIKIEKKKNLKKEKRHQTTKFVFGKLQNCVTAQQPARQAFMHVEERYYFISAHWIYSYF